MSLRVSTQVSIVFVLLQNKMCSISASIMTASYCDFCNMKTAPTLLHLELSRACPVFLSCLSLLTKPHFVCQIAVRMCLFVRSTLATKFTANPTLKDTFLQTKCTNVVTVDSFPQCCSVLFGASYFIECNMKFLLAMISSTNRYLLKYQDFPASSA